MRLPTIIVSVLVLVIVIACGYYVNEYFSQARNLPKDESGTDDWKVAVNQARQLKYGEPVACWILLPVLSFVFAKLKAPTRISWLRNATAVLFTFAVVFLITTHLMHGALEEKNASYVLPPSAIWDAIWFAGGALFVGSLILFTFERIYVSKRVAPHA